MESSWVCWLKAAELLMCLLSSPEVSQACTQALFITVYLQNLQKHSCFPFQLIVNPSGMIGQQHFFLLKKKPPTGAFSVIFTRGNAWLLCLIRGTFSTYSWLSIFKNETMPLCLRKQLKLWLLQFSSGLKKKTKLVRTLGFWDKVQEYSGNYSCSWLLQRTPIRLTTYFHCWKLAPLPPSFHLLCACPRTFCPQILSSL